MGATATLTQYVLKDQVGQVHVHTDDPGSSCADGHKAARMLACICDMHNGSKVHDQVLCLSDIM